VAKKHPTPPPSRKDDAALSVLIVDDDRDFRDTCAFTVKSFGHKAEVAETPEDAFELLAGADFDVVMLDVLLGGASGLQVLRRFKASFPDIEVVMMSGHSSVPWAVEAMRSGAADYLVKPFDAAELRRGLSVAVKVGGLTQENRTLRKALDMDAAASTLVGRSQAMSDLRKLIRKVGGSDISVLVLGESGTGKEVVARSLHAASLRHDKAFVAVDCAAIAETLIESELFGHVKGAFTGADRDREGLITAAHGGTLFLDEIGEMPAEAQVRLLRVLESGEVRPVGSSATHTVDVRVIAATNRDLETDETFRRDLYFRLNVVTLKLPPLRDRSADVPLLASHFLARYRKAGSTAERFSSEAMAALERYSWPGNVRELENAVERCCALSSGLAIERSDLPSSIQTHTATDDRDGLRTLDEIRREAVQRTLESVDYDRGKAASILGIDRSTLYRNMKQYKLTPPRGKKKGDEE
jgi:two-component system response regulator HydG